MHPLFFVAASLVCQANGPLPDPICTPGATNPDVTQDNIAQTICVRGWTGTIRPGVSYTTPLKIFQMQEYGRPGPRSLYEEDHLIPLELGGHPINPTNLWPQEWDREDQLDAHHKDLVENAARQAVCEGRNLLADLQAAMAQNWVALGQLLGVLPSPAP